MPDPDRREFLTLLAASGVDALWTNRPVYPASPSAAAPTVVAEVAPFYAHPDGQRCLVRFFVTGLDAPAGRMRAFDDQRRQVGTAGVIPLGDGRLYGELWLPLRALPRIRTELEAPGLRRSVATWHALTPRPRWTIYWITLLDPEALGRRLSALDPMARAVEIALLRRIGAMVNPVPHPLPGAIGDVPFLRLAEASDRVATRAGTALGSVAAIAAVGLHMPSLASVLSGSGVTTLAVTNSLAGGLQWLQAPDGSRLLVAAVPAAAAPERLAFVEGGDRMVRAMEQLLTEGTEDAEGMAEPIALVVGAGGESLARAAENVRDWNARFAHPRIVVGDARAFRRAAPVSYGSGISSWPLEPRPERLVPALAEVADLAELRAAESHRRAEAMIACLASLVPGPGAGLDRIANQLAMPLPGTLVFNPTSYARTELVRMADGSERMATDVPPLGYAYFPRDTEDGRAWRAAEGGVAGLTLETAQFRLELDPDTGAIRSAATREDGREWVNQAVGLDAVDGARLEGTARQVWAGVGGRIMAQRRTPQGQIRTAVTVYEHLPWIEVVNHAEPGEEPVAFRFGFALRAGSVEWEVPAGLARATPPCPCTCLRWLLLAGQQGAALLAARQAALAWVDPDGVLTSYVPRGQSQFRIGVHPGEFGFREDPWRFGWGIEPVVTAPVPGTGPATLPSFGSLLVLDQPGIAIVGLQPAVNRDGVIVYLQELSGRARVATLGAGLIGFEDARLVDLIERDLGAPAMVMRNGVGVMLPARGVAAVRLQGVSLARV